MTKYDSTKDTKKHIDRVRGLLLVVCQCLNARGTKHDASKLESPEKEAFDIITPRLKEVAYGSADYKATIAEMRPAIDHHYAHNSHHPEHYANGVNGMSLVDLVEMLCDWKAAGERHADDGGDIRRSLTMNTKRFNIGPQLEAILANTIDELWPNATEDTLSGVGL